MKIGSTFAQAKHEAEKRQQRIVASLPEPKVINLEALITFNAPRSFIWGGVGYRAPPLSFLAGVRLLVAANALRDLRTANAPEQTQRAAARVAAFVVRANIVPLGPMRRLRWRLGRRPFRWDDPQELEGLCRWLHHVPDDSSAPPPPEKPGILDFADAFAGFVRAYPAWVGTDGLPVSWAAYLYGVRHLTRAMAREDLRRAISARWAGADSKGWSTYFGEQQRLAGWQANG